MTMRRRSLPPPPAAILGLALLWALPAGATSYRLSAGSDDRLAAGSDAVAVVRVESVDVEPCPGGRVRTEITARIEEPIRGVGAAGGRIVFELPGGRRGDRTLRIPGLPTFTPGERLLALLERGTDGATLRPRGLGLGLFFEGRGADGRRVAVRRLDGAALLDAGGRRITDPARDWDLLVTRVRALARGESPAIDPALVVEPSSSGGAEPAWELFDIRWVDFDSGQSVAIRASTTPQSGASSGGWAEVQTGLGIWTADPGSNILYSYGGTTSASAGFTTNDGNNVVLFNDPNDEMPSFSCSSGGVLAIGGSWYSTATVTVNDHLFNVVVESDIVVNDGLECILGSTAGLSDFAEILTHELGHTLGLDHSASSSALMYPYCHCDGRGAFLSDDDKAAVAFVYPQAGGGGGGGGDGPTADFTFSPAAPAAGETIRFTDKSTGEPSAWSWTFGDGATSGDRNPTHAFAAAGRYVVQLTVYAATGQATATKSITVAEPSRAPVAGFSWTPSAPASGQPVAFQDASTGGATSWLWSFGDGSTSMLQNPGHTFATAGTFTVTLAATNAFGSGSVSKPVVVGTVPSRPQVAFGFSPPNPQTGQPVEFWDESTGSPYAWSWEFGDGDSAAGATAVHVFRDSASRTVTLRATNDGGTGVGSRIVHVKNPENAPQTRFSVIAPDGTAVPEGTPLDRGVAWLFRDESLPAEGAALTARLWNFGDGGRATTATAGHAWSTTAASVLVTLRVTQSDGRIGWASRTIPLTGTPPPPTLAGWLLPAAARAAGSGSSFWRTDLTVHAPSASPVTLRASVWPSGTDNSGLASAPLLPSLAGGGTATLGDLLGNGAINPTGAGSGATWITLEGDAPTDAWPILSSRTYSADPAAPSSGSFGQAIPAIPLLTAASTAQPAILEGLRTDSRFRTNIGLANRAAAAVSVDVEIHAGTDGAVVASARVEVPPSGHLQFPLRVDRFPGLPASSNLWAVVTPLSGTAIAAYASVVDNATNDPSYVAAAPAGTGRRVVPGIARAAGQAGTVWRSDLHLVNPGSTNLGLELTFTEVSGGEAINWPKTLTVLPGRQAVLEDVAGAGFWGFSRDVSGFVTIHAPGGESFVASARTYNASSTGTFGQWITSATSVDGIGASGNGRRALLVGPAVDAAFRTNVGAANLSATSSVTLTVSAFDGDGHLLGTGTQPIAAGSFFQRELRDLLGLPTGEPLGAPVTVRLDAAGQGTAVAWASVVDNVTGDPVYLPAVIPGTSGR